MRLTDPPSKGSLEAGSDIELMFYSSYLQIASLIELSWLGLTAGHVLEATALLGKCRRLFKVMPVTGSRRCDR